MHLGSFFLFKIHITNIAIVFIIATIDHQHHQGGGSEPFRALKGETKGPGGHSLETGKPQSGGVIITFHVGKYPSPPATTPPQAPTPSPPQLNHLSYLLIHKIMHRFA